VPYGQVNAMLLNEFLKEHQAVQELKNKLQQCTAGPKEVRGVAQNCAVLQQKFHRL
jgi:hypothetical protein